jgi:DNA-directed RNA polymerase specialized sigma24 family protein
LLYNAKCKAIAKRLFRLGISTNDIEDGLQKTYLEAWRGWNKYDSTMGTRVQWLYGITANIAAQIKKNAAKLSRREEPQADDFDALSTALGGEEYMEINDRARFVARLTAPIDTIPLSIFIAHEMDGESMEDIARYHGVSLSTAYRHYKHAEYIFTEGYNRDQEQQRKAGALVLPVGALALLAGPQAVPDITPEFQAHLWSRIENEIGKGPPPNAPRVASLDAPARLPLSPFRPGGRPDGGAAVRAIRAALVAHPIAAAAVVFAGGALAALAGEHLFDMLAKGARVPMVQEARGVADVGPSATLPTSVPTGPAASPLARAPSDSAAPKAESGPGGPFTAAELRQYDMVRAAVRSPDASAVITAIQEYLKSYPGGHFVADCEKMRIEALIRAHRIAEAQTAIDRIRKRSLKNPSLNELESGLPSP